MSPLTTELYQTEAHLLMLTSPTNRVSNNSIDLNEELTDCGIGSDPVVLGPWLQVVKREHLSVLALLVCHSELGESSSCLLRYTRSRDIVKLLLDDLIKHHFD